MRLRSFAVGHYVGALNGMVDDEGLWVIHDIPTSSSNSRVVVMGLQEGTMC